ncbi:MAG: SUMF1/EgtB/PvdO family nonheme iron enzyme [Planctomycetota bacterium]|nr:SUMF1/EgtB/PvdO family nonheme iron enzyme [Planctomycetota bacterium]
MKAADEHDLRAPYPGLRPFQPPESPIFFGRARQTNEMLKRLERQRFLAVVGASGSGKSSLVRAGLLPALQDGYLRGVSSDWRFVIARPGVDPYGNLAEAFCRGQGAEREPTGFELSLAESVLRSGRRGVVELLHKFDVPGDRPVLLLIDQFEELFRFREAARRLAGQAAPDGYQQRNDAIEFVDLLLRTAEQADRPVYVILTMRSEFMGDCDAFFGLPEAISASQFLTPRLTRDQSAEAIEGPLDQFHGAVAPEVVNQIVNEVGSDPDQLPLMQHALLRMWQLACDEAGVPSDAGPRSPDAPLVTLGEQHYNTAGRVAKALDLHASGIYAGLGSDPPDIETRSVSEGEAAVTSFDTVVRSASEGESASVPRLRVGLVSVAAEPSPQQRIAQWLFRCLAERTPQGVLVRRLTTIGEVATVAGVPAAEVAEVVAAFTGPGRDFLVLLESRLQPDAVLPESGAPLADGTRSVPATLAVATTIDISHESLLRQWQLLREWVTAEADAADELRKLVRDAKDWDHGLRNLLRQPELGVFRQWRNERVPSPAWARRYASADEFALADRYLDESGTQEKREQQEEKDARQRELSLARRRAAIAMTIAAAAIISLAFAAWQSSRLADSNRRQTEVLVKATVAGSDDNFLTLVDDLRVYQAAALAPLREIVADPKRPIGQRGNAALVLAAFGDSVSTARPALALDKVPSGRTKFIHGYPRFHGDLTKAALALEAAKADPAAADFRSGLCAALGLIPWGQIRAEEQAALRKTLVGLYVDAPDGGTHSAAFFALKHWGQEKTIPSLLETPQPWDDRGWAVNSLGMTMVRIPHDSFTMGDGSGQAGRDEKPPHEVTLTQDFYLGDREVTVRQFKKFVQEAADHPKCEDEKQIAESWGGEDKKISREEEECPVQMVSWFHAVAFCNWLSHFEKLTPCYGLSRTGTNDKSDWKCDLNAKASGYRLPTEAQWEYACRAVSQTQYAFGDDMGLLAQYGYYANNSENRTWPAGDKLPNGWGLFDMHGNVWEWCHDGYASYPDSPSRDPSGDEAASSRGNRGGCWGISARYCRSAGRNWFDPSSRYYDLGFRVARSPSG